MRFLPRPFQRGAAPTETGKGVQDTGQLAGLPVAAVPEITREVVQPSKAAEATLGAPNAGPDLDILGEVIKPAAGESEDLAPEGVEQDQGNNAASDDLLEIFEEAEEVDVALAALAADVEEIGARDLADELRSFAREIGIG